MVKNYNETRGTIFQDTEDERLINQLDAFLEEDWEFERDLSIKMAENG